MAYNQSILPGYVPNIQSSANDIQGVPWVSSIDEVKSASVFNGVRLFMDNSDKVFYSKNMNGEIRAFKFEEIPIPSNNPANFVTKQEFEELKAKYDQLLQMQGAMTNAESVVQQQAATIEQPAQSNADNAGYEVVPGFTGTSQAGVLQPSGTDGSDAITTQPVTG